MAKQTINVGSSANDGTGDPNRTAFQKCNSNFDELYSADITNLAAAKLRSNHTGTQLASTISDIQATISANAAVAANTAKVTNVTTNITFSRTSTTVTVESSDGTDAILPVATTTLAGVMSAAQVTALNANTAKVSNVTTDLTLSQTSTTVTILSSDGTDAIIPTATDSLAGVMSAAQAAKLNTASAAYTAPWI